MKELAKECLEIHEKIKQLSPIRQGKGDKLAADIKSQLLNVLGEDFNDIGVWCNCGDSFLEIFINARISLLISSSFGLIILHSESSVPVPGK